MSNELSKYINILFLIGLLALNNLADFSRTLFCAKFAFFAESCRAETHHPDSGGGVGGKGSRAICFTLCFKGLAQQHQFQSYSTKSMRSHGII